ncbi:MAG TPA: UbiD family decarboxylase, partial [Candidatus Eisenbacteria bacterium]|nr:UbiD family decarboxylase [Candidatus Eisenbacteria bacterium]
MPFNDLREFIEAARRLGQVKEIHGAHWRLEIGALTEIFAYKEPSPLLLFDQIPDHQPNFRVAANIISHPVRSGLTVGMPADATPLELVVKWRELLKGVKPLPPRVVADGPILQNVKTGSDIDMTIFPAPQWHELDGGRYIGTADCVITAEPEEGGWVNVGIYRAQVHDPRTLGLYVSPGHHARIMREKYWQNGQSCPVVVTFGQDPLLFLVAGQSVPYGSSELDYCGGLRGAPVDVIRGEVTGLPIP